MNERVTDCTEKPTNSVPKEEHAESFEEHAVQSSAGPPGEKSANLKGKIKNDKFLAMYAIILFSCAAVIILLSYLYNVRVNAQNAEQAENSQLLSLTALQTVDSMREEISLQTQQLQDEKLKSEHFQNEIDMLQDELSDLQQEQMALEARFQTTAEELAATANTMSQQERASELLRLAQLSHQKKRKSNTVTYLEMLLPLSSSLSKVRVMEDQPSAAEVFEELMSVYGEDTNLG